MIVSIHQPNYLPWTGFFHKIANSDIYVVFDDVQLPRGKDYILRNKIKTQHGPKWLRVPVLEQSSMKLIYEVKINNNLEWSEKHWNSLKNSYFRAAFFAEYETDFQNVFKKKWDLLVDLNLELITLIMKILNINTKLKRSSELKIESSGTKKILGILEKTGADKYLTGWGEGSRRYIEGKESLFEKKGIRLQFQNFNHPVYPQLYGEFVPNLTMCDMIFNVGKEQTRQNLGL